MKRGSTFDPRIDERGRRIRRPIPQAPNAGTVEIARFEDRPSFLIQNGTFTVPSGDFWRAPLEAGRSALEAALGGVGRIDLGPEDQTMPLGTGFLVGPDLFLTNRHVALALSDGREAWVDLRAEHEVTESDSYRVAEVVRIASDGGPDAALLRLGTPSRVAQPLTFSETSVAPGHRVASVGYPGYQRPSSAEYSAALRRIFQGIFDVKRLAPGVALALDAATLAHDCTNLPGSSGSAVLDLATGLVVGLDYGALPGRNLAVPGPVVADWLGRRT